MRQIKVSCLPVAGIGNPYQYLMIKGLNHDPNIVAQNGVDDRFFGILRTAISQRPDYIHFDWETSYYYRRTIWMTLINFPLFVLQVLFVRYILGINLVWTLHNIIPHDAKYLKIHRVCRRFFARNMVWIRLFSESSVIRASEQLRILPNKFRVVPEGSYVDYYPNSINQREARKLLNLDSSKRVLLYFGFIKPYKGISKLIDEFFGIDNSRIVLVIAGKPLDIEYFEAITRKAAKAKNIHIHGDFIKDTEVQLYFNAADIVVFPFDKIENSGSVILAMGFCKPIIAPNVGVVSDRLSHQAELLFTDSLGNAIKRADRMPPNTLHEIGLKNIEAVQRHKWTDFSRVFIGS